MGQAADDRGSRRRSLGEQVSKNNTAPFRADHVGSLLRTAPLKEARVKRETGATIRAFPFDQPTEPGRCIRTGKETTQVAVFARAY